MRFEPFDSKCDYGIVVVEVGGPKSSVVVGAGASVVEVVATVDGGNASVVVVVRATVVVVVRATVVVADGVVVVTDVDVVGLAGADEFFGAVVAGRGADDPVESFEGSVDAVSAVVVVSSASVDAGPAIGASV